MGCRTEPAAVHIAHVLQRLGFFQFFNFFYNLHDLPQKKNYTTYRKNKKIQFFFIIHTTYSKKKNYTHSQQKKKITRLYGFFVHDLHFSPRGLWTSTGTPQGPFRSVREGTQKCESKELRSSWITVFGASELPSHEERTDVRLQQQ